MRSDRVVFTGSSYVSHPVLDRLFGGLLKPQEGADLKDARLVVVDARQGVAELEAEGIAQQALNGGVAVLVIAPGTGQLAPLAPLVGVAPNAPAQAVLITPGVAEEGGQRSFEIRRMLYPGVASAKRETAKGPKAEAAPQPPKAARPRPTCHANAAADDVQLGNFVGHVERRAGSGFRRRAAAAPIPPGLKYFLTTVYDDYSFTCSVEIDDETYTNGRGLLTTSYDIWGFLSQSQAGNAQYLIIEATYTLNPGTFAENNEDKRGFGNTNLESALNPSPGVFNPVSHIPTGGENSWNEPMKIEIPYIDPLNGEQFYTFETTVNQTITSFSVKNVSSGAKQGSMWFMNSPCDGSDIMETWEDAFTGDNHLDPLPSACMGVLTALEASAWRTTSVQSGNVRINLIFEWEESLWVGTNCGLIFCYDKDFARYSDDQLDYFDVSFAPIAP